ncbi:hypothetical protein Syun_001158 [Stephania yunnanensis]|uniref:Uncharacterized protein n=1 Tax=Stephania yunnanensis TaxID=152371 RepID=A0AAP0LDA9_9MAGN
MLLDICYIFGNVNKCLSITFYFLVLTVISMTVGADTLSSRPDKEIDNYLRASGVLLRLIF